MDTSAYTFVIDVPRDFEADVLTGRRLSRQVRVDATGMSQAGVGAGYRKRIFGDEIQEFVTERRVLRVALLRFRAGISVTRR